MSSVVGPADSRPSQDGSPSKFCSPVEVVGPWGCDWLLELAGARRRPWTHWAIKLIAQSVAGRQVNGSVAQLPQRSDGRTQHNAGLVDLAALDDHGHRINAIFLELGI